MLTSRLDFLVLFHFMNLPSSIVESISFALGIIYRSTKKHTGRFEFKRWAINGDMSIDEYTTRCISNIDLIQRQKPE